MVSVLYVDDDECLLEICQTYLNRAVSIDVDVATSAEDGLARIAAKEYDAIISDYEMPVMNGIDFLKILRSQRNRTPFIIFTGRGREEIAIEAFNSGADYYIQKGGDPRAQFTELIHKVTMAFRRRQGERALENSNSILRATLESTADGILVVDNNGFISMFNQKFLQMWNLPANACGITKEKEFLDYIHDQLCDYESFKKPFEWSHQTPESGSYDIITCKDGRTFRRFSKSQKINDRIVGRVWSFRDITGQNKTDLELRAAYEQLAATKEELQLKYTELKKGLELLQESEKKYHGVFNAVTCPLLLVDLQTFEILDLNDAAVFVYGFSRDEMLARTLHDLSAETTRITDEIREKALDISIHFHRKKNQGIFPVEISSSPCSVGNRPVLIISIRDISRTKQIEDALKLSNVKLNLLLGITRHDILNKILVLSGYNEILHDRISDPALLEVLDRQQKATSAIQKHLEFTKEYEQLGLMAPFWHRIDEIAARAFSQMLPTITFRCETGNLEIYADPMVEKVFYNLFDNAFRYGEGITRISITWSRANENLIIIFEDDGIGIADDEKEVIFQRGYGKNSGLGLFLSREILSITRMTIHETGQVQEGGTVRDPCTERQLPVPAGRCGTP